MNVRRALIVFVSEQSVGVIKRGLTVVSHILLIGLMQPNIYRDGMRCATLGLYLFGRCW